MNPLKALRQYWRRRGAQPVYVELYDNHGQLVTKAPALFKNGKNVEPITFPPLEREATITDVVVYTRSDGDRYEQ